jgi:hypothetical protein
MADHRRIEIEVLREFVRTQAELTSLRAIAEDAGVPRSTVHKFANENTMPHPRIRRLLGLWYLRRAPAEEIAVVLHPWRAAVDKLLSDLAGPERRLAERELLYALEGIYDIRRERPRWLELLAGVTGAPDRS